MEQYRQGDVFIEKAEAGEVRLPETAKDLRTAHGEIILAYGEVTGHAHRIDEPNFVDHYQVTDNFTYLKVYEPVSLRHEEHAPIELAPGEYIVRLQREYSPRDMSRPVAD